MADPVQLGREITAMCRGLGFALAGVSEARSSDHARELIDWLEAGRHGSMAWMEKQIEERIDPRKLLPGARSMVLVGDVYSAGREARSHEGTEGRQSGRQAVRQAGQEGVAVERERGERPLAWGRIARYARGDDYHEVIKKRLHALVDGLRERFPNEQFKSFTDTSAVLEREHAARAGLGWIGKHTLLIHPEIGSYMLLGGVLATLELAAPPEQKHVTDHCGTCTRCIDACPTKAITPYSVDATRCISYLTIEHRGRIEPEFHKAIGDWLFGCDVCQEVCPHNGAKKGRQSGSQANRQSGEEGAGRVAERRRVHANSAYAPRRDGFDVLEVLGWAPEDRSAALKKSAIKRATLEMMKRNAVIVAGNALRERGDESLRARIRDIARDPRESELVRATASDVMRSLGG